MFELKFKFRFVAEILNLKNYYRIINENLNFWEKSLYFLWTCKFFIKISIFLTNFWVFSENFDWGYEFMKSEKSTKIRKKFLSHRGPNFKNVPEKKSVFFNCYNFVLLDLFSGRSIPFSL